MKKLFILLGCCLTGMVFAQKKQPVKSLVDGQMVSISTSSLLDKIKGGWAGQTIGVTYGGPYEFRFNGTMIGDYQPLEWPDAAIKWYFDHAPGLFDDIYMDLSFVDVINRYGVNAPVDSFAQVFANAPYPLWHANQGGRYNILNGIRAPQSGHWRNNPHADDIDFQIEADFAGLMYPGMCNTAAKLCDKVGHIMNYGDGWYGGVYVSALYTQAFVTNDIHTVVRTALKSIPASSTFYQCIDDVIKWHQQYPNDWRQTWFEVQRKWTHDVGCPDGVFSPFDISARVNAAYFVIGLLYGAGDFEKTMEIAIRCGQDADCNPASAAGILGTMIGYDKIPEKWKRNLREVEDRDFVYTSIPLNEMYQIGLKHALEAIQTNGGIIGDSVVKIAYQLPKPVRLEQSFLGVYPTQRKSLNWVPKASDTTFTYSFEGNGIAINAGIKNDWDSKTNYVFDIEVSIDGKKEIVHLPFHFNRRKNELYTRYNMPQGKHQLKLTWLNPSNIGELEIRDAIIYTFHSTSKK